MAEDITLDKEVFKALAGDTRISLLKSLRERRKTQSELAKELGIAAPTVKEHVDILQRASLVREIDDGHKWKYIELTIKGKGLLEPSDKRILVLLGSSVIGIAAAAYVAMGRFQDYLTISAAKDSSSMLAETAVIRAGDSLAESSSGIIAATAAPSASPAAAGATTAVAQALPTLPFAELLFMAVCLVVFGVSVGMWIRKSYS